MAGKEAITLPKDRADLVVCLQEAQRRYGHVSEEVVAALAESLAIPVHEVYGVASFYSFLSTKPLGRNVIRVCKSLPCFLKSAEVIMEAVEKELGIGFVRFENNVTMFVEESWAINMDKGEGDCIMGTKGGLSQFLTFFL